ncbi:MAG: WYL domain-containing protein [bacterium]
MNRDIFFKLNTYEGRSDSRVPITLSARALLVIEEDIFNYTDYNEKKISRNIDNTKSLRTKFINKVFEEFAQYANSTITTALDNYKTQLQNIAPNIDVVSLEKLVHFKEKELIEQYVNITTIEKLDRININNSNTEFIEENNDLAYYYRRNDKSLYANPGKYIESVIEEYCALPNIEREKIFFKKFYDIFQNAIINRNFVEIVMIDTNGSKSKYKISPYLISPDDSHKYIYLVGLSTKLNNIDEKKLRSFRLSKIHNLKKQGNSKTFFSEDIKKEFNSKINDKGVMWLNSSFESVKIRFTQEGLKNLKGSTHLRPQILEKLDENTYIFEGSKLQIYNYFFKFGKSIEILEPEKIRKQFKDRYKNGFDVYNK